VQKLEVGILRVHAIPCSLHQWYNRYGIAQIDEVRYCVYTQAKIACKVNASSASLFAPRLRRQSMFNEASLSTIRLLIRIFYILKRRNFSKNLTFSCEVKIALDIEDRKRIVMIIDCYVVHKDI